MKTRVTSSVLAMALCASLATPTARADGDQMHGETYRRSAPGLGVATAAIGLSGRRPGTPSEPLTSGELVLSDVPGGAVIVQSYLYWVTYAAEGDPSVTLDGTAITGTLAGTSANTCWEAPFDDVSNHVYRADVTSQVDANGTYVLTGFPSGLPEIDTQGATLVVIYEDPADALTGTVVIRDGALTVRPGLAVESSFEGVTIPEELASATWRLGVGDGESVGLDGALRFEDVILPAPDGVQHWRSTAGRYWDLGVFDVTALLTPGSTDPAWSQGFQADCLVLAFTALELHAAAAPAIDAGTPDGGGAVEDAGASIDASAPPSDGGAADASARDAGPTPSVATDGCGCRAAGARSTPTPLLVLLALALFRRRARNRGAKRCAGTTHRP